MKQELLHRFLYNQCTEQELKEVLRWVEKDALSNEGRNQDSLDWKNFQEEALVAEIEIFNTMRQKIHQKIISAHQMIYCTTPGKNARWYLFQAKNIN